MSGNSFGAYKSVVVNGKSYRARKLLEDDLQPGALVRHWHGRSTYKLLCCDGDDAILRSIRYPDKVAIWPVEDLTKDFLVVLV